MAENSAKTIAERMATVERRMAALVRRLKRNDLPAQLETERNQ